MTSGKFSFNSRLYLQLAIAVFGLVPIAAGAAGMIHGGDMIGTANTGISLDSHIRYLSGILFGIGIGFWSGIPRIEHMTARFRLLTFLVFIGGIMRLAGVVFKGIPSDGMMFGLGMELVVTPLLCLWQSRVAARFT